METIPTDSDLDMINSRKRRKLDAAERSPLKQVSGNRGHNIFNESDSDDDEPNFPHKISANNSNHLELVSLTAPRSPSPELTPATEVLTYSNPPLHDMIQVETSSGRSYFVGQRIKSKPLSYERMIASRSTHVEGAASKSYYGINIYQLTEDLQAEKAIEEIQKAEESSRIPSPLPQHTKESTRTSKLWTERYRAQKFTDLVGDERTHRTVLRWLKRWDSIVFPGSRQQKKSKPEYEENLHRKILILAGPPGLGKTTLAHVCARQAGYEVHEINGSDERTAKVVKERIRDMLATDNVRGMNTKSIDGKNVRKTGRPQCIVVDEVDGVVGGGGGGGQESSFIKALIDLVQLDQKNSHTMTATLSANPKKLKKDRFRMLRPLILVCNDIYHPALRVLRQSSLAEIIHMRRPPIAAVISRLLSIFEKEGVKSDQDSIRRLCEAIWGVNNKKDTRINSGTAAGDIRSVLVVGEWVASKFRVQFGSDPNARMTRTWIDQNFLNELDYGGSSVRNIGRGNTRDVVERIFQEDAGFLKSNLSFITNKSAAPASRTTGTKGVTEAGVRRAVQRLQEMIHASGETDRILTDCFTSYPTYPVQDDMYLTKPNAVYEWLHFYDAANSLLNSSQEWEIAPYLPMPILAFHTLFAQSTASRSFLANQNFSTNHATLHSSQFSGPAAHYAALEALRVNNATVTSLQAGLNLELTRTYRSRSAIASELAPYLVRLLSPAVTPVIIQSSSSSVGGCPTVVATVRRAEERERVARSIECMAATGVRFVKARVEDDEPDHNDGDEGERPPKRYPAMGNKNAGWVFRMEPAVDSLLPPTRTVGRAEGSRYAVRQVLEGEWSRHEKRNGAGDARKEGYVVSREAKLARQVEAEASRASRDLIGPKKDFFGRAVKDAVALDGSVTKQVLAIKPGAQIYCSHHEGYSNAVRRPITLQELMRGL